MKQLVINGNKELTGEIKISGAKNSVVALIPAAILSDEEVTLYRPPFGEVDDKTMDICKSLGYQVVKWNIDSLDWKEIGTQHVIDRVIRNSEPGSIVLFHANVNGINYYLDDILTKLKQDNYDVVSVSELLYEGDYIVDSNGVQKIKK